MVRRGREKPYWMMPGDGEELKLTCIHREGKICPVAKVPLEIQGMFRWKRVGVVRMLPHPVVIATDWSSFPLVKGINAWRTKRPEREGLE